MASYLIPELLEAGDSVVAALHPAEVSPDALRPRNRLPHGVETVDLELADPISVRSVCEERFDRVVHLAAISSVRKSRQDPAAVWEINVMGTLRLAEELGRQGGEESKPTMLFVSSSDVYGPGPSRLRNETDRVNPVSPYAGSKLAGEIAVLEAHRRTGLNVIIARAFPHTGPGQSTDFVVPAFVDRLLTARETNATVVRTGNLEPKRECMNVVDVVIAYRLLLEHGEAGEVYNVCSGVGIGLRDLFYKIADIVGHKAVPETDLSLSHGSDIMHMVGDNSKLVRATGWSPRWFLNDTLSDVAKALGA